MQTQQKQAKKPRNPLAAMAAEIVTANENAPAAEVKAKKPRTTHPKPEANAMLVLTERGIKFTPRGKSEVSKTKDAVTWANLTEAFKKAPNGALAMEAIVKLVGDHKSYIGYMLRRGWVAVAPHATH